MLAGIDGDDLAGHAFRLDEIEYRVGDLLDMDGVLKRHARATPGPLPISRFRDWSASTGTV